MGETEPAPNYRGDDAPTLDRVEISKIIPHPLQVGAGRHADEQATLTAEKAAKFLGVSVWTLYAAANRGEVPHRRIGRRMLFSRRALVLWLEGASPRDAGKE